MTRRSGLLKREPCLCACRVPLQLFGCFPPCRERIPGLALNMMVLATCRGRSKTDGTPPAIQYTTVLPIFAPGAAAFHFQLQLPHSAIPQPLLLQLWLKCCVSKLHTWHRTPAAPLLDHECSQAKLFFETWWPPALLSTAILLSFPWYFAFLLPPLFRCDHDHSLRNIK